MILLHARNDCQYGKSVEPLRHGSGCPVIGVCTLHLFVIPTIVEESPITAAYGAALHPLANEGSEREA